MLVASSVLNVRLYYAGSICLLLLFVLSISGCSTKGNITNEAVTQLPPHGQRYGYISYALQNPPENIMFFVSFSGGGTRAAAMSYGVLEELRDTSFTADGRQIRLLDEVDRISSVSGGSFTAAYYGLFGDKIFEDFKDAFLYRNVQGALTSQLVRLVKILGRRISLTSRTENAIKYYDKHIFKGKTFADLQKQKGPFLLINATDLTTQDQFTFTQRQFDFFCSDLSQFKVSRAVAASSAVPVLFQPILIKKHPDCNFQKPEWLEIIEQKAAQENNPRLKGVANSLNYYLNEDNPHYATLVDGGVTDNLGLRTVLRNILLAGGALERYKTFREPGPVDHVVILVVNAAIKKSKTEIGKSRTMPSVGDIISAVTVTQLNLYNLESKLLLKQELMQFAETISTSENQELRLYFIEVEIDDIENNEERDYLNNIPTSFSLEKEQSDRLIDAARRLLRKNHDYQRLLQDMGASRIPIAE